VVEPTRVEVSFEPPVEVEEEVLVECRGHASSVVVGRLDHGDVLLQVPTEE